MPLQKIASEDFIFSNEIVTNTCWRNPDGTFDDSPSFSSTTFTNGNPNSIPNNDVTVTNYTNGSPGNLQFSVANVSPGKGLGAIQNIVTGCKNTPISWAGTNQTNFSVVSIARGSYKSALLPGSLRLGIFTDDSNMSPPKILNCGRVYNLIEGNILPDGSFSYGVGDNVQGIHGLFLPDVGLILVDNFPGINNFTLRTEDPTPTSQVFIRARNYEYNYSMNPSFISGSTGDVIHRSFIYNPQTYITTVGLYNDNNVLMAVAKLPRPFNKNFTTELSLKVGLNF